MPSSKGSKAMRKDDFQDNARPQNKKDTTDKTGAATTGQIRVAAPAPPGPRPPGPKPPFYMPPMPMMAVAVNIKAMPAVMKVVEKTAPPDEHAETEET